MIATTQLAAGDSQVLKALGHCQAQGQAESRHPGRTPSPTPAQLPRTPTMPSGPEVHLLLTRADTRVFVLKQNRWLR